MKREKDPNPVAAVNRTARHEYAILETFEAGMALKGCEVKSIRAGGVNLKEGYAHVIRGELFLEGVHVSPYEYSSQPLEPIRSRKLLMHRREIHKIDSEIKLKGLTLVPLKLYFKNGRAKLELGLAKGKKAFDKRESIKKREVARELARASAKRVKR
jgi:SsrA-binding protein